MLARTLPPRTASGTLEKRPRSFSPSASFRSPGPPHTRHSGGLHPAMSAPMHCPGPLAHHTRTLSHDKHSQRQPSSCQWFQMCRSDRAMAMHRQHGAALRCGRPRGAYRQRSCCRCQSSAGASAGPCGCSWSGTQTRRVSLRVAGVPCSDPSSNACMLSTGKSQFTSI